MVSITPGTYVLVREPSRPPWPAVVYVDQMVPADVREKRPQGDFVPVLLMDEPLRFLYVATTDIQDSEFAEGDHSQHEGLKQAYDLVLRAMAFSDDSLKYWSILVADQHTAQLLTPPSSSSHEPIYADSVNDDGNTKEAISRSLLENDLLQSEETPEQSSSREAERQAAKTTELSSSKSRKYGDLRDYFRIMKRDSSPTNEGSRKRAKVDEGDVVDADLSVSKAFVQFLVGKNRLQQFLIPLSEIQKRPYFSHEQKGCLTVTENGLYRVQLPCLQDMHPDDFTFAAEYLQTGKFGYQVIDDENHERALEQCMAAWLIGDRLGMEDLLEHIADKVEGLRPWSLPNVLAFVDTVYMTRVILLDGQRRMKDMLAEYLADAFYHEVSEPESSLMDALEKFPELERDIHRKLAERAEQKMEREHERGG